MDSFFAYMSQKSQERKPDLPMLSKEKLIASIREYVPTTEEYIKKIKIHPTNGFYQVDFVIPLDKVEETLGGLVDNGWYASSLARALPGGFHAWGRFENLETYNITVVGRSNSNTQFAF